MQEIRIQAKIIPTRGLWDCELWVMTEGLDESQKWKRMAQWTFHDNRHRMTDREMIWCILAKLASGPR